MDKTRFISNRPPGKAVSLDQTPPPPQNQYTGRHASQTYMVEPPHVTTRSGRTLGSQTPVNSDRTRTFTRNTSSSRQQQPVQSRDIVRLDQERTGPRAKNEYVDTPKTRNSQNQSSHALVDTICSQPTSLKKHDPKRTLVESGAVHEDSIICPNCQKCKCQKCRAPKELPRTWINKSCECSAQQAIESCTCLCCVQCLLQTFINDPEDEDFVADDPCACCSQRHCCKRWMLMGVLSICLPCLCCYPILKGGLLICNKCYSGCNNNGCKCKKESGIKKLLLDSESSSTTTT